MKWFIALCLSMLPVIPASASLGETEQQLIAHYGPELGGKTHDNSAGAAVEVDRVTFSKGGLTYTVLLFKGVSSDEVVYHRPYAPFTDEDVKTQLDSNAQGQSWSAIAPQQENMSWLRSVTSWQRTDGAISSLEEPHDRQPRLLFHVQSTEFLSAEKAAQGTWQNNQK